MVVEVVFGHEWKKEIMKVKNMWVKTNHLKYTFKPLPLVTQLLKFSIEKSQGLTRTLTVLSTAKNAKDI